MGNNSNLYALCFGETLQGWFLRYSLFSGINMHANNRWIGKQLYENCAQNPHKVLIEMVKLYLLLYYLLSLNFVWHISLLIKESFVLELRTYINKYVKLILVTVFILTFLKQ